VTAEAPWRDVSSPVVTDRPETATGSAPSVREGWGLSRETAFLEAGSG
jgi:hypothetical protein